MTFLRRKGRAPASPVPSANLGRVLYVDEPGAYVRKRGERVVVTKDEEVIREIPACNLDQVVLVGNENMSMQKKRHMEDIYEQTGRLNVRLYSVSSDCDGVSATPSFAEVTEAAPKKVVGLWESEFKSLISHSQITKTSHPCSFSLATAAVSRWTFCSDFSRRQVLLTFRQEKKSIQAGYGDHRLDRDKDGIACE